MMILTTSHGLAIMLEALLYFVQSFHVLHDGQDRLGICKAQARARNKKEKPAPGTLSITQRTKIMVGTVSTQQVSNRLADNIALV